MQSIIINKFRLGELVCRMNNLPISYAGEEFWAKLNMVLANMESENKLSIE